MSFSIPEMTETQLWTLIFYAGYLTEVVNCLFTFIDPVTHPLFDLALTQPSSNVPTSSSDDADDHDSNNGHDDSRSIDSYDDSDRIDSTEIRGTSQKLVVACIPNHEIRCLFRRWLQKHITDRMNALNTTARSVTLFRKMVAGRMPIFAKKFGELIWHTMPNQFLGGKEFVYQAYICAFFTVASEAANAPAYNAAWDIQVERCAGIGRLDLILQRPGDDTGVLQEYKRVKMSEKDKNEGYSDSQCKRLTKMSEEALRQLETKGHRASMKDHVIKLHEYGLAFLGPYCAIVGQSLEREPDEP